MAVSKSTDGGTTWARETLTTVYGTCNALRVDHTNSSVVYAGGYTGLYKSTDAGNTWFLSSTGLSGTVNDIAIGSTKANTIYAGSSSGVFKSTNAGASWTNSGCTNVYAVLINPANENEIYAATYTGVYMSTVGGGSWMAINSGLQNTYVTSLGINQGNWLFCGTEGAGMYRWSLLVGADENNAGYTRMKIDATPNPAHGVAVIHYTVEKPGFVIVSICDIQGREVVQLVNEKKPAGTYSAGWNGEDAGGRGLPAGVYFCRLAINGETSMKKIVWLK
ncbi:MAG TPA: T9SS type A sorting domain-containing protein [bacterium]|jgi:hypothetical protein